MGQIFSYFLKWGGCAALLLCTAAWGETINCTPITSVPYTITAPGVYCVTTKITSSLTSGAAITINANNVVLDLNSFAIGNIGAGPSTSAVGILAIDRQNIVVRDGTLRGFWAGVALVNGVTAGGTTSNSSGHKVDSIIADTCYLLGIAVQGPGSWIINSRTANTQGSSVANAALPAISTNSAIGIFVSGAGSRVTDNAVLNTDCTNGCTASTATVFGIEIAAAPGAVVDANRVSNFTLSAVAAANVRGLYVINSSTDVFIDGNRFTDWQQGIDFDATSTGLYIANGFLNVTTVEVGAGGTAVGTSNF